MQHTPLPMHLHCLRQARQVDGGVRASQVSSPSTSHSHMRGDPDEQRQAAEGVQPMAIRWC